MNFILDFFRDMGQYLNDGGMVMVPLMGATAALWFGLAYRWITLKRGTNSSLRGLMSIEKPGSDSSVKNAGGYLVKAARIALRTGECKGSGDLRTRLDETLHPVEEDLCKYRSLVKTIVIVAPLAGLLGTVSGMIEMFDSMGTQTFHSQTGGIANGISQALFTTQFGLVIAIPGMIAGRALDKKEDSIHEEIDQMKEYLTGTPFREENSTGEKE